MLNANGLLLAVAETSPQVRGDWMTTILYSALAGYVFYLWWQDYKSQSGGEELPAALPGATPWTREALIVAAVGGALITGVETLGEYLFDIVGEQSILAWHFLFAMIAAAVIEELIFRGYLIVLNKGKAAMWASIVGFSVLFGLFHDFLWSLDMPEDADWFAFWEGTFSLSLTVKGFFSFAMVVAFSLFLYYLRVARFNPQQSLAPCMVAHAVANLAVWLVKLAQGFIAF